MGKVVKAKLAVTCLLIFVLNLLISLPVYAADTANNELTINDALTLATQNNPELVKLGLQVDRYKITRDKAAENVIVYPTSQLLVSENTQAIVNNYEQAEITYKTTKKQQEAQVNAIEKDVINAYAAILKNQKLIEKSKMTMQEAEKQKKLVAVALQCGMASDLDVEKLNKIAEQAKQACDASETSYQSALSTLRKLLNKGDDWTPKLVSTLALEKYMRDSLNLELGRAADSSVSLYSAKAALELEQTKDYWPGFDIADRNIDKINLREKELDYESAKRDTKSSVEQMYYQIDSLEIQIANAKVTCAQKDKDYTVAKMKYDLGLIPNQALSSGQECLSTAESDAKKAHIDLDNMKFDLMTIKANFAYLTGKQVFVAADWKSPEVKK